ncbi:PIN domain-containing protein [Leifsonia sp. Le1]|uniref:PIN domain-containing protein n=1 Tax=Leifsonia sp. Le1 TaxID=3404918 RepID=UPI003EBD2A46
MPFRVFVDANVLVRGRWRDIVLTLASTGLYDVLWSPLVLEEVGRHLPETMSAADREHLFETMDGAFPEASISWPGAVDLDIRLQVNEKDRHVVAAALWGHADVLLTEDAVLRDEVLASGLLDAQALPVFLAYAIDSFQPAADAALIAMARRRWLNDPDVTDADVRARLCAYFAGNGWPDDLLRATE